MNFHERTINLYGILDILLLDTDAYFAYISNGFYGQHFISWSFEMEETEVVFKKRGQTDKVLCAFCEEKGIVDAACKMANGIAQLVCCDKHDCRIKAQNALLAVSFKKGG